MLALADQPPSEAAAKAVAGALCSGLAHDDHWLADAATALETSSRARAGRRSSGTRCPSLTYDTGTRARINIPAGTQSGHQFRLRGKGMSVLRSPARGDMFIEAVVETPVKLTPRQQELLREFETEAAQSHSSPESEGFFAKVKEFWKGEA